MVVARINIKRITDLRRRQVYDEPPTITSEIFQYLVANEIDQADINRIDRRMKRLRTKGKANNQILSLEFVINDTKTSYIYYDYRNDGFVFQPDAE